MASFFMIYIVVLISAIGTVHSKCGEKISIKRKWHERSPSNLFLYPITVSKTNQSYNVPMVMKEIAYRTDYFTKRRSRYYIVTYDFCNDLATLIDILLTYTLDYPPYLPKPTVYLHADAEFIKTTQAILAYFFCRNVNFITDVTNTESSTYSAKFSPVYKETSIGYIKLNPDEYVYGDMRTIISMCYVVEAVCQCLPIESRVMKQPRVDIMYITDYSDAVKTKQYLQTISHTVVQVRVRYVVEYKLLMKLWKEVLKSGRGYEVSKKMSVHSDRVLNCSKSIFIAESDKAHICNETMTVKVKDHWFIKKSKKNHDPITSLQNYTCKPICPFGHTIQFNKHAFNWKCQLCTGNSVKNTIGNEVCKLCARGWQANVNKTFCYDTYHNLSLQFTDNSSIIMMSVSGVMLSGISSTIFLYIKYSETPVVKTSNLLMSYIQLAAQLLIAILMPFLFIGEPNIIICTLRPICIGILLTMSTAVTFSKTRSFLRIFQSKIKLSRKEHIMIRTLEIFILIMFVVIDACILLVSFEYKTPKEVSFVSDVGKYREKYCNTDNHLIVQFGFIFIILFLNSIQAIRARHLPSNFKETRVIMFANMLSSVIVGNIIWSSFLQKNFYWKSIFLFYAIFLLNGINFITLYGYKIYILLFLPHLNSKKYFNYCIMKKFKKQANRL